MLLGLALAAVVIAGGATWVGTAVASRIAQANSADIGDASEAKTGLTQSPQAPAAPGKSLPPVGDFQLEAAGPRTEKQATSLLEEVAQVPLDTGDTDADLAKQLENVAQGSYLEELTAQWQELVTNEWSLSGAPTVVSTEVTDADATQATVRSCLDYSNVTVKDSAGNPVGTPDPAAARALHIFTLTAGDDGVWRVLAHTFSDDPAC
ncbi:hypothetical protein ACXR2W_03685 [Leucobacter sp. HY1908]